jgi:hypothetical protein
MRVAGGFATGLLTDLIVTLRRDRSGALLAITGDESAVAADLASWWRFTGNSAHRIPDDGRDMYEGCWPMGLPCTEP